MSFELLLKDLLTKNLRKNARSKEELKKELKNGIDGLDGRCHDLLLQEHCKKLFNLMDIFLCVIKYVEVDVNWLLKVKSHLDKLEKIQSQFKRKKLKKMSTTHYLREWFLRDLMRTFRFSNSEMFLMHLVILNFQTLRIFTILLQLKRVAVMILPMLEKLKQTFVFRLIIIKVNTNFSKRKRECTTETFSFTLYSRLRKRY